MLMPRLSLASLSSREKNLTRFTDVHFLSERFGERLDDQPHPAIHTFNDSRKENTPLITTKTSFPTNVNIIVGKLVFVTSLVESHNISRRVPLEVVTVLEVLTNGCCIKVPLVARRVPEDTVLSSLLEVLVVWCAGHVPSTVAG